MPVEACNIEVFTSHDIFSVLPDGFDEAFWDGSFLDVSFGDAEYTLVRGQQFIEALKACWDDGDWATDAMWNSILEDELADVNKELSLVAIEG